MTEDEAKQRMCCGPQVVAMAIVITAPTGTVEVLPDAGRCIGSACMAWRWRIEEFEAAQEHFDLCAPPGSTGPVIEGFCGLAGAQS